MCYLNLFIVAAVGVASFSMTVDGTLFEKWDSFSHSNAFTSLVRNPLSWVKETYVGQLHSYRLQEFRKCLKENDFDSNKIVIHGEDAERYEHLNQPWNLRKLRQFPLAFILPSGVKDVTRAVRCGAQTKLHLVPNSGGLSFESISWGTNQTVVLDFRNMREISIEVTAEGAVVTVQPGALVGHIHAYLWKNGGYGLPLVNQLTAGMAGDAIGGGHGPFSSLYGLTVDSITELEMVDSFGEIHQANPEKNPDLWFGLRGMGPGYIGILTEIKLKVFKASDLQLTYVTLNYPLKRVAEVFYAFQKFHSWAEGNDPSISRSLYITNDAYNKQMFSLLRGTTVHLLHIQDPLLQPRSNAALLKAVSTIFPKGAEESFSYPNYFQFVTTTGYAPIEYPREIGRKPVYKLKVKLIKGQIPTDAELHELMDALSKDLSAKRYFKSKSLFVNRKITKSELDGLGKSMKGMPPNILIHVSTQTGAVQRHARNENAYVHRNSTFNLSVRYEGTPKSRAVELGLKWMTKFWDAIQFVDSGETYQNYADLDIKHHYVRNYKRNFGKLVDTKRKWDPQEYFQTELSLPIQIHHPHH